MRAPARPLVVLLSASVLLAGLGVADWVVGRQIADRTAETLDCRLGVSDADVEVAGWPRALPLLTHRLPEVTVRAEDVPVRDLTADVDLHLEDVRRSSGHVTADEASAVVSLPVADLADGLRIPGRSVELQGSGDHLVATVGTDVFPVSMVFAVGLQAGRLTLRPDGVVVGGRTLSGVIADQLAQRVLARLGGHGIAQALDRGIPLPLPSSVDVVGVAVDGPDLELSLSLDPEDPAGLLGGGRRGC